MARMNSFAAAIVLVVVVVFIAFPVDVSAVENDVDVHSGNDNSMNTHVDKSDENIADGITVNADISDERVNEIVVDDAGRKSSETESVDEPVLEGGAPDVDKSGMKERIILFQRNPVEVGHVQDIEVTPGRVVTMKTVATKPPLFEITNLLSHEECDHIIELGMQDGLMASTTVSDGFDIKYGVYLDDGVTLAFNETRWNATFSEYDVDHDGFIDFEEVHACLPGLEGTESKLTLAQIQRLYKDMHIDSDSNGLLNLKEFWVMQNRSLEEEVTVWLGRLESGEIQTAENTRGQDRISEQTWLDWVNLNDDPLLSDLPERLTGLTGLDTKIIRTSEKMQVVRYYPGGHYHAHYDSSNVDPNTDCIHTKMNFEGVPPTHPKGRLCRYITIMYYLSDVDEGGETAFPVANNVTYSYEDYAAREMNLTDLSSPHCRNKNVVVRPEKGKVVMWYNHGVYPETGWVGVNDAYSLHGGCDVIRGVKWIANNWITVDDVYSRQIRLHDVFFPPQTPDTAERTIGAEEREMGGEPSTAGSVTSSETGSNMDQKEDSLNDISVVDKQKDEL